MVFPLPTVAFWSLIFCFSLYCVWRNKSSDIQSLERMQEIEYLHHMVVENSDVKKEPRTNLCSGLTQMHSLQEHSYVVINYILTAMIHFLQNTNDYDQIEVTC